MPTTTRTQTPPDPDPAEAQAALAAEERAELERLRQRNAELEAAQVDQAGVEPVKGAVGATYVVGWNNISLLAADNNAAADVPRYVLPKGTKADAGFTVLRRGQLVAAKNEAGDRHLRELATIGAVRAG